MGAVYRICVFINNAFGYAKVLETEGGPAPEFGRRKAGIFASVTPVHDDALDAYGGLNMVRLAFFFCIASNSLSLLPLSRSQLNTRIRAGEKPLLTPSQLCSATSRFTALVLGSRGHTTCVQSTAIASASSLRVTLLLRAFEGSPRSRTQTSIGCWHQTASSSATHHCRRKYPKRCTSASLRSCALKRSREDQWEPKRCPVLKGR